MRGTPCRRRSCLSCPPTVMSKILVLAASITLLSAFFVYLASVPDEQHDPVGEGRSEASPAGGLESVGINAPPEGQRTDASEDTVLDDPRDDAEIASPLPIVVRRDPWAVDFINQMQPAIEEQLEVLRGSDGTKTDAEVWGAAHAISRFSVAVIYCAENRAIPPLKPRPNEPDEEFRRRSIEHQNSYGRPDLSKNHVFSNGARYVVPFGEFPVLDQMKELKAEWPNGVPAAEVPFDQLESLAAQALLYRAE